MAYRGSTIGRYVKIEGSQELRRALRQLEDKTESKALGKELKAEYKRAAEVIVWRAQRNASALEMSNGALASTIKARGALRGAAVVAGTPSVPYAGPIEFGWPTRPNRWKGWRGGPITARRYLRNAVEEGQGQVIKIMERGVMVMLRKVEDAAK